MKEKRRKPTHQEVSLMKRRLKSHYEILKLNDLDLGSVEIKQKHWKSFEDKRNQEIIDAKNKRLSMIEDFKNVTVSAQAKLTQYELELAKFQIVNWDSMVIKFKQQIKQEKNELEASIINIKADSEERLEIIRITEDQITNGFIQNKEKKEK